MMVDGVEESQLKGPIDVLAPYTSRYSSPNSWLHALVETTTAVLVQETSARRRPAGGDGTSGAGQGRAPSGDDRAFQVEELAGRVEADLSKGRPGPVHNR